MDKQLVTVATFNKYATDYQDRFRAYPPYLATYEEFARLIPLDDARVLDIGCGPGHFSAFLRSQRPGLRITGIDLAPAMIELAKQTVPDGEFLLMDCRDLSGLEKRFDVMLLGFCLPYLSREDTRQLLREAAARLTSGGLLYLSMIEGDYRESGFQSNAAGDRVFRYFHDRDFLVAELGNVGLEVRSLFTRQHENSDGSTEPELFVFAQVKSTTAA